MNNNSPTYALLETGPVRGEAFFFQSNESGVHQSHGIPTEIHHRNMFGATNKSHGASPCINSFSSFITKSSPQITQFLGTLLKEPSVLPVNWYLWMSSNIACSKLDLSFTFLHLIFSCFCLCTHAFLVLYLDNTCKHSISSTDVLTCSILETTPKSRWCCSLYMFVDIFLWNFFFFSKDLGSCV